MSKNKVKLKENKEFTIAPLPNEIYSDCPFRFGDHLITRVESNRYFQIQTDDPDLQNVWWDAQGFEIKSKQ